ncbi:MAG: hypothetical protein AAFX93_17395 [Verrucomicrobiota bacterium]
MMKNSLLPFLLLSIFSLSPLTWSQTESPTGQSDDRLLILESLQASLSTKKEQLARLEEDLANATNDTQRDATAQRINTAANEFIDLNRKFEETASGVNLGLFDEDIEQAFSWEHELGKLLKPVFSELNEATAESRNISDLRDTIETFSDKASAADEAIENIETILKGQVPDSLIASLESQLQVWNRRSEISKNQAYAAELQLKDLLAKQESLLDSSTGFAQDFMKSRGLSILLAVIAFVATYWAIRVVYKAWLKTQPVQKHATFSRRLVGLLVKVGSILFGTLAIIIVFNLRNDWFLLGISTIFLLGAAWAGLRALPQFIDAIYLILNLGPVREGEIIEFDGLMWRVDTIGFKSDLVNDRLESGHLRVPFRNLLDKISRPASDTEVLFPTRKGDWVLLNDSLAEVIAQNPNHVTICEEGCGETFYPSTEFIGATPINLSNGYRVEATFGVDYSHQAIATTTIPAAMLDRLQAEIPKVIPAELIVNYTVDFANASASSLDYEIEIDLKGGAAKDYETLTFAIQRILVELCSEKQWNIPFPQLTITKNSNS